MKLYTQLDLKFRCQIFKAKASNIIKGLWYWIVSKHQILYEQRITHCNDCESNKKYTCGECGCFKQAKLRVDNEFCPLDKW